MKPLIAFTLALGLLFSVNAQAAQKSGAKSFTWVGCGITKKAFMSSLSKAYEQETGIKIDIKGGGATKGIREVDKLSADMGGACRYVLEGDEAEDQVKMIPMAWDALVVIAHPDNPVESITVRDLESAYRGQLTNWSSLGGRKAPIRVFVREGKISGVGRTLRELVFKDTELEFRAADSYYPSSGPLEQAVENSPNALAVTGISSARKRNVKILKLNGKDPSYENIKNGDYLLYRPLYLVVNVAHENYQDMLEFADYANSPKGREIVRNNGVVPYLEAPALLLKQMEQWSAAGR